MRLRDFTMDIKTAVFLKSASQEAQFLRPEKPMIVICGKSNSGKSSLINLLAGQKNLAKIGAEPGKTRLINYFDFGSFWLADLPGYGYASVSKEEKERWGRVIETFFRHPEDITHVFLLTDIRRDPSKDDLKMINFLNFCILPFTVIATKSDKLSKGKIKERTRAVANVFGLGEGNVLTVSSVTKAGKDVILKRIDSFVTKTEGEKETLTYSE